MVYDTVSIPEVFFFFFLNKLFFFFYNYGYCWVSSVLTTKAFSGIVELNSEIMGLFSKFFRTISICSASV